MNEDFLNKKLKERNELNAFRTLRLSTGLIDFCSNDYLGIARNNLLQPYLAPVLKLGSGGSRLLAGNYSLIEETENLIANFHESECALIFNSGYDANIGLFSCVPQKGDIIFYDNIVHASIRDGIRLSFARSFSFLHNDLGDLEAKVRSLHPGTGQNVFVVTESVFSMDGDLAPLEEMAVLCEKYNAHLVVDEAHATGVVGESGEGCIQHLHLQKKCFARVHTFGKACGVHGAAVLGSKMLRDYLINFSRPFIYTTSLPEASVAAIHESYKIFPCLNKEREVLRNLIEQMQNSNCIIKKSKTPIQAVLIPGNTNVKNVAEKFRQVNLDVRAILYPTVPRGSERLRIVLHSYNTSGEVDKLLNILGE